MANINSPSPANEPSIFNGGLFYLPLTPCPSKDSILCSSCLCSFYWGGEEEAGSENKEWGRSCWQEPHMPGPLLLRWAVERITHVPPEKN